MRLIEALREPRLPGIRRVHAAAGAADACFAVSLAGSLFFSVSLDAARPRIILYLAVTITPFIVMAPLVGPMIDRLPGGERLALVVSNAARAVLAVVMAVHLTDILFYPEAFAMLVLGKAYTVGRSATVPHIVDDPDTLVAANSALSLTSVLAGAVGGGLGIGLLNLTDAGWVLRVAAVGYLAAAVCARSVPLPGPGRGIPPVVEYEELHAPSPVLASAAMMVLRGAVGFLTFHLGFALKRAGEPGWFFAVVFAAGGVGTILATVVAPRLKPRLHEEGMLAVALAAPALLAILGGIGFSRLGTVIAVGAVGAGASAGRQAFDALIQRDAPHADRARMFARFETYFQLGWVLGALVAVALRLVDFAGMLLVGTAMAAAAGAYVSSARLTEHRLGARSGVSAWARALGERCDRVPLGVETLVHAERLHVEGAYRQVVVLAALSCDLLLEAAPAAGDGDAAARGEGGGGLVELDELGALRAEAVSEAGSVSRAEALHALILARRLITRLLDRSDA
ncbi:MAG: MFS transporter [Acidimicrobiia bacterium]